MLIGLVVLSFSVKIESEICTHFVLNILCLTVKALFWAGLQWILSLSQVHWVRGKPLMGHQFNTFKNTINMKAKWEKGLEERQRGMARLDRNKVDEWKNIVWSFSVHFHSACVYSVSCSCLAGVKNNVVIHCCSPCILGFDVLCVS